MLQKDTRYGPWCQHGTGHHPWPQLAAQASQIRLILTTIMTPVPLLFIAHKPLCFSSLPSIHNILAHLSGAVVAFQSLPYCMIVDLPYQKITLSRSHHLIGTLGYRCILPNKPLMGIWRGKIRSFSSLSGKHFYSQSLHNSRDLFSIRKKPCGDMWIFSTR